VKKRENKKSKEAELVFEDLNKEQQRTIETFAQIIVNCVMREMSKKEFNNEVDTEIIVNRK
jgi:hypothetical protein